MVKPVVEEYVPPVVPVKVTDCGVEFEIQNGLPAYEMVAVGEGAIVTNAVDVTMPHPLAAGMV